MKLLLKLWVCMFVMGLASNVISEPVKSVTKIELDVNITKSLDVIIESSKSIIKHASSNKIQSKSSSSKNTRDGLPIATSFDFQLVNIDSSIRLNNEYLRSNPVVYNSLFVENLREELNIKREWYEASGRLYYSTEDIIEPSYLGTSEHWSSLTSTGWHVILGTYSVKVIVQTKSGLVLYEKQIDFKVIKEPTDPSGQYLVKEASTSSASDEKKHYLHLLTKK